MKKVVSKMKEEICKRMTDEEIPLMAAMLSPDTKNFYFLSESERNFSTSTSSYKGFVSIKY